MNALPNLAILLLLLPISTAGPQPGPCGRDEVCHLLYCGHPCGKMLHMGPKRFCMQCETDEYLNGTYCECMICAPDGNTNSEPNIRSYCMDRRTPTNPEPRNQTTAQTTYATSVTSQTNDNIDTTASPANSINATNSPSVPANTPASSSVPGLSTALIAVLIVFPFVILIGVGVLIWCLKRRRSTRPPSGIVTTSRHHPNGSAHNGGGLGEIREDCGEASVVYATTSLLTNGAAPAD